MYRSRARWSSKIKWRISMRFSLFVATVGGADQLQRFLTSVDAQTHRHFELIVDQNSDDRGMLISASYQNKFPIHHLRTQEKGASRARKIGLQHVSGDVVAFPDDCKYPADLLAMVARILDGQSKLDGVAVCSVDEEGRVSNGRLDERSGPINGSDVWAHTIEYTMFLREQSVRGLRFNERIGPGVSTPLGAGEGTDFLCSYWSEEHPCTMTLAWWSYTLRLYHPMNKRALAKAYSYGAIMGYVLKKHKRPIRSKASRLVRPLGERHCL
jgi:glycosyltransferase involved in cell wall biosynthesis